MIEEDIHNRPAAEAFSPEAADPATLSGGAKPRSRASGKKKAKGEEKPEKRGNDKYIWAVFIVLCAISIVEQYSASSREISAHNVLAPILRHCALLGMGATVAWALSRIRYQWFIPFCPVFVFISIMCMIYVLFWGQTINGAARSFSLMGIQIQPPEMIKLSAVLTIAFILARTKSTKGVTWVHVACCAGIILFFGILLFSQGLTNTMLMMCISLAMMLIGGVKVKQMLCVILVYAVAGVGGMLVKAHQSESMDAETQQLIVETGHDASGNKATLNRFDLWKARIDRFMGSDTVPKYRQPIQDDNLQEMRSYMAQANGGLFGVMPGNSREAARIPVANIDFVYAIVIEEWGFLGGLLLMLLYLSLLGRAGAIAARCHNAFPALLALGMAVYIVLQALCHMAIVTGAGPVSGQPLPLISKGGSSILITSIAFGILLSVSRYAVRSGKKKEIAAETAQLPEEMQSTNPTMLK